MSGEGGGSWKGRNRVEKGKMEEGHGAVNGEDESDELCAPHADKFQVS